MKHPWPKEERCRSTCAASFFVDDCQRTLFSLSAEAVGRISVDDMAERMAVARRYAGEWKAAGEVELSKKIIVKSGRSQEAARTRDRQAAAASQNETEESDATEEEATRESTTRRGRPRGGTKVAARIGERLRREIGRGGRPRVGDG